MSILDSNRQRFLSAIALIDHLCEGDFPHEHSKTCLERVRATFDDALQSLNLVDDDTDPAVVQELCAAQSNKLYALFDYLGLFVRSTDVRNAFEFHGPFLRIVQAIIGPDSNLVISSEWEYSPFTILPPDECDLDDTVMIGIPASESGNALVLPLAGHELGHNVWVKLRLKSSIGPIVEDAIIKYITEQCWGPFSAGYPDLEQPEDLTGIFGRETWKPCWNGSMRQCQELFCDFIGLAIFGESFLNSFSFLLAPGFPGLRSEQYPGIRDRATYIAEAATKMGISVAPDYAAQFVNEDMPTDIDDALLLAISDTTTKQLVGRLVEIAWTTVAESGISTATQPERIRLVKGFRLGVPSTGVRSIADIINAAWDCWTEHQASLGAEKYDRNRESSQYLYSLSDLVFKTLEVFEIEQISKDTIL